MDHCLSCGSPLHEGAMFCSNCGAAVVKSTDEKAKNTSANAENVAKSTDAVGKDRVSDVKNGSADVKPEDKPFAAEITIPTGPKIETTPKIRESSCTCAQNVHTSQASTGSSVGIKILSIFLSIILGAVLFTASLNGIARGIMSSSGVEDIVGEMGLTIVDDIVSVNIDGEEIRFSEQILDAVDEDIKKKYNLNEDTIADVLRATKADEFVSEVISDYTGYIIDGDELNALDGKRVVGWIRENESEIEDVISYEFTEDDYKKLEADIDKSDFVKSLSEEEIKDEAGDVIAAVRAGLSVWIFVIAASVALLIGVLIVAINRRKVRAVFTYISITIAVVGGLQILVFLLASVPAAYFAINYMPVSVFIPSHLINIIGSVVAEILRRGFAAFVFGVGTAIACKLICDRKKYHA